MAGNIIEVTACVLTLNEENFIEDCLEHLKRYVNYILVLDGGSTDKTFDIARRHANAVIVRPFRGSFADERNYLQEMAITNWCLHCDADERFHPQFLSRMKEIISTSNVHCFRFPRVNQDKTYLALLLNPKDHQVRLVDRRYCYWVRPVHEIVWSKIANKPADQYSVKELSDYPITHLKRPNHIRKAMLNRWKTLSN